MVQILYTLNLQELDAPHLAMYHKISTPMIVFTNCTSEPSVASPPSHARPCFSNKESISLYSVRLLSCQVFLLYSREDIASCFFIITSNANLLGSRSCSGSVAPETSNFRKCPNIDIAEFSSTSKSMISRVSYTVAKKCSREYEIPFSSSGKSTIGWIC